MTQTNTTRTLFKVTKVLGILLIGGSVFVLEHGKKTIRKGLQHAAQTPRQIMVPLNHSLILAHGSEPRSISTGQWTCVST